MYTIFKNDLVIKLTNRIDNFRSFKGFIWNDLSVNEFRNILNRPKANEVVFYHQQIDELWQQFKDRFNIIIAGGGIVQNPSKAVLFIYRHNKWDLPKGKIESNESVQKGAIREVKEECGFRQIKCEENFIEKTYHIYEEKDRSILKESVWYLMYSEDTDLQPQVEEGITKLQWFKPEELEQIQQNTYPNIKQLITNVLKNR